MSIGGDVGYGVYRGRTPWAWAKRLLNPLNYINLISRLRVKWGRRLFVLWIALVLQFRPQSVHRFSTQKLFPKKNHRLQKTSNPLDDFRIDRDRTSDISPIGSVTVVMRGSSFESSEVDQLPGPIYAVNPKEKLHRQDVVYITADSTYLDMFVTKGMFPILYVETNSFDSKGNYITRDTGLQAEDFLSDPRIQRVSLYYAGNLDDRIGMPAGSGFAAIVVLGFLAESMKVYGWDFYMTSAPARFGYLKGFFKGFVNLPMEEHWNYHIDMCIYNWHYAYRFSQLPNCEIHGYLGGLEKHQGINDRLDRIFYDHRAIG